MIKFLNKIPGLRILSRLHYVGRRFIRQSAIGNIAFNSVVEQRDGLANERHMASKVFTRHRGNGMTI